MHTVLNNKNKKNQYLNGNTTPYTRIYSYSENIFWIQSLSAYFFNSIESHMVSSVTTTCVHVHILHVYHSQQFVIVYSFRVLVCIHKCTCTYTCIISCTCTCTTVLYIIYMYYIYMQFNIN